MEWHEAVINSDSGQAWRVQDGKMVLVDDMGDGYEKPWRFADWRPVRLSEFNGGNHGTR